MGEQAQLRVSMGSRLIALLILAAAGLFAQMGSPGGGETQAIALHPLDPNVIYVGAAKGLCKTTRGGLDNWPSTGLETLSPRVIVINPREPDTVYAGTYEMGIYKTVDGAAEWKAVNRGLGNLAVRAVAIEDASPQVLYAGTDGGGVFKTVDGGANWSEKNRGLLDKVVRGLLLLDDGTLLAATWHGVYRSEDGADHWSDANRALYDVDVRALAVDPQNSRRVYAGTVPRGVFRSDDGGRTWEKSREPLTEHIHSLAVDPNSGDVYAGTGAGVFRSRDRGETWHPAGLHWSSRAWTLVFDARTDPPTLYYGGEGGVLKTRTGGYLWDVTGPKRN